MTIEPTEDTKDQEPQETRNPENGASTYEGVKVVVHVKDGRVLVGVEKPGHDPQFIFPGATPEQMFGTEGITPLADWVIVAENRWNESGAMWAEYDRPKPPPKEPASARQRSRQQIQVQADATEPREPEAQRPRLF